MVEPYIQKNKIQYRYEIANDIILVCDHLQIQETMMNILMNAMESMDRSGGILTIRSVIIKKEIVIETEDAGYGIPIDIRTRVLEMFFTTKQTMENHGLGLSYSHNVMQKHGGSLEILSEVNVGTKVSLRFPHYRIVHNQKFGIVKDTHRIMEEQHV